MKSRSIGILSLLFLVGFVIVTSCEKDENNSTDVNLLYGLWTLDTFEIDILINGISPLEFIEDEFGFTGAIAQGMIDEFMGGIGSEMDLPSKIDLMEDGTYVATLESGTEQGDWTLNGTTLIIDPGTIDETKLTIVTLTATKLLVRMQETSMEDITEDNVDESLAVTVDMHFNK